MGDLWNSVAGYVITGVLGLIGGSLLMRLRGRIRALPYTVWHNQIGASTEGVLGKIEVRWAGQVLDRLFTTRVELINESHHDFTDLTLRIIAGPNTLLHTQHCEITNSTLAVAYSPNFRAFLPESIDAELSAEQVGRLLTSREYVLPIFNRQQRATFLFLSTVTNNATGPVVFLELLEAGATAVYRPSGKRIMGVPERYAVVVGLATVAVAYAGIVWAALPLWLSALVAVLAGVFCRFIGAAVFRLPVELLRLVGR
ncbi:hypothetical protein [Achromobacter denitrificans]|jgi:hypothetical protein|uniref:hypothetical protein n=1 Tax=Achromobacter denitrificans TaxID=32002 RepID=UPI000F65D418|nr:hypothetical protein [Achromobacter denitrificans]RSE75489.1 hypothetical protein EGU64_31650 [Achromobacter denitrificans]